jgi:hypothetical protein
MFGKQKMRVDIKTEKGLIIKKCEIEDNSVIIEKGSRGRGKASYKANYDSSCVLDYWVGIRPFKRLKQKLMLMDGADSCISFKKDDVNLPVFDRSTSNRHIVANVIKNAGATTQKLNVPLSLYLIVGAVAVIGIINLLLSSGRVRFV